MRGFPRVEAFLVTAALVAATGCGGGVTKPRTCEEDTGCASGSRCVQRSCVANASPVARIALPPEPVTYDLLTFDGAASSDADAPLDAVASYSWTFRAIDAPCPAPASASTAPQATVRFGCAGRYAVDLEVADGMGATSAATRELVVGPRATPLIEVGQDVVVEHACSGEPLVCRPEGAVALAAAVPTAPGDVTYRWTVEPPADRPLDGGRRVTFDPNPEVSGPTVVIETDGVAISGDWIFRVAAADAAGPLGEAAVRVSVGNRAPAIVGKAPGFPHTFDSKLSLFSASGVIPVKVTDPDGDPIVERAPAWRHVGDGNGQFGGVDTGASLTVDVRVIYAAPEDALHLIGGEGLERAVELRVRDVNGADAFQAWPIEVANRAPVTPGGGGTATVAHRFDATARAYVATAQLSATWTDPDGDPLFQSGATADPECPSVSFVRTVSGAPARAEVACAAPFVTFSTLQNFARQHVVTVSARDPWADGGSAEGVVTIENASPVYHAPATFSLVATCTETATCCRTDTQLHECIEYWTNFSPASTVDVSSLFTDADGDPLQVSLDDAQQVCAGSGEACVFTVHSDGGRTCGGLPYTGFAASATDGVTTVSNQFSSPVRCAP